MTGSQFCWKQIKLLNRDKNQIYGDGNCWLCGGKIPGRCYKKNDVKSDVLFNICNALYSNSTIICLACECFLNNASFIEYVNNHPEKNIYVTNRIGWRNYSHYFGNGVHEMPNHKRWRELLSNPPEPPFVFCIAKSGQKHLLYRTKIATSAMYFPIQYEEETCYINNSLFKNILTDVEFLLGYGFSKFSLELGRYHHNMITALGIKLWPEYQRRMELYRSIHPHEFKIAIQFARK